MGRDLQCPPPIIYGGGEFKAEGNKSCRAHRHTTNPVCLSAVMGSLRSRQERYGSGVSERSTTWTAGPRPPRLPFLLLSTYTHLYCSSQGMGCEQPDWTSYSSPSRLFNHPQSRCL